MKGKVAVAGLNDREKMSRQETLDDIAHVKEKVPHYMYIELERIISDVRRYTSSGKWKIEATEKNREKLYKKEYQNCLLEGF